MEIGDKVGMITLISTEYEDYFWNGKNIPILFGIFCCDCGVICRKRICNVLRLKMPNCGCMTSKLMSVAKSDTGVSHSKFGRCWRNIKARCNNPLNICYQYYGGHGIICERKSLREFYDDMYESYLEHLKAYGEKNTTIERIDVNGNYCKENCKRATIKEQARNKSNNIFIEYKGESKTLAERANLLGIKDGTLRDRINKSGRSIYKAFNTPVRARGKKY